MYNWSQAKSYIRKFYMNNSTLIMITGYFLDVVYKLLIIMICIVINTLHENCMIFFIVSNYFYVVLKESQRERIDHWNLPSGHIGCFYKIHDKRKPWNKDLNFILGTRFNIVCLSIDVEWSVYKYKCTIWQLESLYAYFP